MSTDKFLRVPIELAQQLEHDAMLEPEYRHSRAKWADYARDLLRTAVKTKRQEKRN